MTMRGGIYVSIRFAILPLAVTTESLLLAAYRYAAMSFVEFGPAGEIAVVAVPLFGLLLTYAIMIMEWRTKLLRHECLERGIVLEVALSNDQGLFHRIRLAPKPLGVATQTMTIRVMYIVVYLTWLILAVVGILT